MRAIDATHKPIVTIDPAATIDTAAQRMYDSGVGALVVVDGETPIGVVTDRDIVVRGVRRAIPATWS